MVLEAIGAKSDQSEKDLLVTCAGSPPNIDLGHHATEIDGLEDVCMLSTILLSPFEIISRSSFSRYIAFNNIPSYIFRKVIASYNLEHELSSDMLLHAALILITVCSHVVTDGVLCWGQLVMR